MRGPGLSEEEDREQVGSRGRGLDLINSEELKSLNGRGCLVKPEELKGLNGTLLVNPEELIGFKERLGIFIERSCPYEGRNRRHLYIHGQATYVDSGLTFVRVLPYPRPVKVLRLVMIPEILFIVSLSSEMQRKKQKVLQHSGRRWFLAPVPENERSCRTRLAIQDTRAFC